MSKSDDSKVQTASTVEAIRMASASVLGSTTGTGFPLGSAIGSGSMMELNAETVAMNITPLIFTIRDSILNAEGLELLSLEWDLERTPGQDVLPEQLIIAGGSSEGVGSHVCVLSFEKGIVDPFKIDEHMQHLAKKISDIESAVTNTQIPYESDGLAILRRFNDRLNNVIFVEMMDRRFQGSWDSFQLKKEQVDLVAVSTLEFRDDFTLLPAGPEIVKWNDLELVVPTGKEEKIVEHFKYRILTPSAIRTLSLRVPEAGRGILTELNTYAYSVEEVDIAKAMIAKLTEYLGLEDVTLKRIPDISSRAEEFWEKLKEAVSVFAVVVETHIKSGKSLDIEGHKKELHNLVQFNGTKLNETGKSLADTLVVELVKSLGREFPKVDEIRAWQLKSAMRYFLTYAKKTAQYFAPELKQYLLVTSAREAFISALNEFRTHTAPENLDPTDRMLFQKFYDELFAQLNAVFARKAFEGSRQESFSELVGIIAREMGQIFKRINIWDLIEFTDVAEIARTEIKARHSQSSDEDTLDNEGQTLMELLTDFERMVSEVVPDVADSILSKNLLRRIIDKVTKGESTLFDELKVAIERAPEKPPEWTKEALSWVSELDESFNNETALSEKLLGLLQFVHGKVREGVTARAIAKVVEAEAKIREDVYQKLLDAWEDKCRLIEQQNKPIKEHNQKREDLLQKAREEYEAETSALKKIKDEYQEKLREYEKALQSHHIKVKEYEVAKEAYDRAVEKATTDPTAKIPSAPEQPGPAPLKPTEMPREEPEPLETRLARIEAEYPPKEEKPFPPEPTPNQELMDYVELRDLLNEKLDTLEEHQLEMESIFGERLKELQDGGTEEFADVRISIGPSFLDYLMNSVICSLSRLLPRTTRAYLRDPKVPGLLYLVTYEHTNDEITVSIGDTYLKNTGGAH